MSALDNLNSVQFYHGTAAKLSPGDSITPGHCPHQLGYRDDNVYVVED
jgi:hypothetical protein